MNLLGDGIALPIVLLPRSIHCVTLGTRKLTTHLPIHPENPSSEAMVGGLRLRAAASAAGQAQRTAGAQATAAKLKKGHETSQDRFVALLRRKSFALKDVDEHPVVYGVPLGAASANDGSAKLLKGSTMVRVDV
eukprot:1822893-Pleurochrysis_carterae.AAC.5